MMAFLGYAALIAFIYVLGMFTYVELPQPGEDYYDHWRD